MNPEEIKELIEVTKMLSYLQGFIDGHGVNAELSDKEDYPYHANNINDVHDFVEVTEQHHEKLILKFKDGNTTANK